jgi:hypothetical protein
VILAVSGSTRATPGAHLFVAYADGSVSPIKLIWVSRPIQAGFYYKVIPRSHRTQPHRAIAVELVRGTRIIARQTFRIPRA